MNGRLKFRVWDGTKFYFATAHDLVQGYPLIECKALVSDLVFDQFTESTDKDGREIYEGDIYTLAGWTGGPWFCVHHDGAWWNRATGQSDEAFLRDHVNVAADSQHDLRSHARVATVIGNIHEHPHLLAPAATTTSPA